jgi:N-acetylmuramoyl-L-alanine amidase
MRWNRGFAFCLAAALLAASGLIFGAALSQPAAGSQPSRAANPSPSPPSRELPKRTEFFVMIDPSHGGDDKGATLGGKLLEKDLTLALARELRRELEDRGIPARLLRESDSSLSLERRAEIANEEHAAIYVALHAGLPGNGVRVYMPMLPSHPAPSGPFLRWEGAQTAALDRSKGVALAVAADLRKAGMTVSTLATPLRPLNNLVSPAIAVEWTPRSSSSRIGESQKTLNLLASAIATGIARVRWQMGAHS